MDTITCIKTRRSIRQFKEQEVTKDVLEDIVQTASFAPSWKNTQTTRYIAITDPKVKARLAEEGCKDYPFNQKNINAAPAIIATTIVDKRSGFERDGSYSTVVISKSYRQTFNNEAWQLVARSAPLFTCVTFDKFFVNILTYH